MIVSIFISIYACLLWSIVTNTELGWLSYVFSTLVCICSIIASTKYHILLKRIAKLEKKSEDTE